MLSINNLKILIKLLIKHIRILFSYINIIISYYKINHIFIILIYSLGHNLLLTFFHILRNNTYHHKHAFFH
jgi:hypothetical protein